MNKKVLFRSLAGVGLVAAALIAYRAFGWGHMGPVNGLKLDLSRPDALVMSRAVQPLGFRDAVTARVPGFEDVTDQPDWGDDGFSGRKSDIRVIRFDRLPRAPEGQEAQANVASDA